jgi:hypothetical protein
MKSLLRALVVWVALFGSLAAFAQDSARPQKPALEVHRRTGAIAIDGDLSDDGWKSAARATDFWSAIPILDIKAPVATDAYITYDDEYLYVAMRASDPDPSAIHASLVPRDRIWDDDFMGIILDTYGDATKSFEVYVNPRGIQGDLFWSSISEDGSYDMIYDAEAKITDSGWQMEMRIPFSSLRFPERAVQDFHLSFWRNYPRETDYKFSWAPINFTIPCVFCQLGTLTGIEGIRSNGNLELLPALVAIQGPPPEKSALITLPRANMEMKPSLNARLVLGTATGVEATIKPDFSQVEADAAQVSANSTFALFYPEHRPFFQDGSDLWNTFLPVVYTRSMSSPIAAAKVLHRDAVSSYAFLSSYDENTPIIIPLEERSEFLFDQNSSYSNILRATHTFGEDRYLGLVATDRRYAGNGSNTVFGIDGRLRLFENVAVQGQQLFSLTHELDNDLDSLKGTFDGGRHTLAMDGETFSGNTNVIALERMTPGFDFHVEYGQTSPAFRAGDGFITSNSIHNASGWIGYKWPLSNPPAWAAWIVEIDASLTGAHNWNYDGEGKLDLVRPKLDLQFTAQTDLHVSYQLSNERFAHVNFARMPVWQVQGSTKPFSLLAITYNWKTGESIYYDASSPARGTMNTLTLTGVLKPIAGLMIEPSYTFSRLDSLAGAGTFYSGTIYWARITYQFSRQWDLRVITQYDGFAEELIVDPLLTYRVNPFTSFYLGSAHNFVNDGLTNTFRPTGRQFFAKLQYLIQT